ncbi:MAG: monofunctional biosynthetic peptidoglycan transglycosylase [Ignavibacteria bacterium]|nr:monofunctional biosynthetic peptidoglycan transglycosylase [Ignavibacteria bacterium]
MFKLLKFIAKVILFFFISSISIVIIYKFIPPPITPIMIIRVFEGWFEGKNIGIKKKWVSYEEVSKNFFRAVVSAEDSRFMNHNGFDWDAIEAARRYNEARKGKKLRGASTISMQTAKNAFLWHGRNYVRKALEAYFTILIEFIWGKKRILEVYVNIIEFGEGIFGVQAASEYYFKKNAKDLNRRECALLAAVLPNPRRWSPINPTPYIEKRVDFIQGRMNSVVIPK